MIRLVFGLLLWCAAWSVSAARAEDARIPVVNRSIAVGEVIADTDLDWAAAESGNRGTASRADQVVGRQARRPIYPGNAIPLSALRTPILIERGALISLTATLPGIALSTTAKALEQGGLGDTVRVMNASSNRVVQAVVTGPGSAAVPLASVQP